MSVTPNLFVPPPARERQSKRTLSAEDGFAASQGSAEVPGDVSSHKGQRTGGDGAREVLESFGRRDQLRPSHASNSPGVDRPTGVVHPHEEVGFRVASCKEATVLLGCQAACDATGCTHTGNVEAVSRDGLSIEH